MSLANAFELPDGEMSEVLEGFAEPAPTRRHAERTGN